MGTGRHPAAAPQEKATGREPRAAARREKVITRERRAVVRQERTTSRECSAAARREKAIVREPRAVVRQEKDTSRERRAAAPQEKGTVTEQSAVALQEKGTVMGQSAAVLRGKDTSRACPVVVLSVRIMRRKCRAAVLPEALVMVMESGRAGKPEEAVMAMKRHRVAALGRMGSEFRMNVGSRRRIVVGRKRSIAARNGSSGMKKWKRSRRTRACAEKKNRFFLKRSFVSSVGSLVSSSCFWWSSPYLAERFFQNWLPAEIRPSWPPAKVSSTFCWWDRMAGRMWKAAVLTP